MADNEKQDVIRAILRASMTVHRRSYHGHDHVRRTVNGNTKTAALHDVIAETHAHADDLV